MIWLEVDWELCQVCDPCLARKACKVRAIIKVDPDSPAMIDQTRCNGCALCLPACAFGAIALKSMPVTQKEP